MSWSRGFEHFLTQNVPLARRTTYRVGGPAQYFAEPPDAKALSELLWRAAEENVPVRFLGGGSNLLVADRGVSGVVIHLPRSGFGLLRQNGAVVHVGAAHSLPALVKWSVGAGLLGLECLQGVPGSVGAALRMNAGGKYGEIGSRVRHVSGFELDGKPFEFDTAACGFTYRHSRLAGRIVTACELQLTPGEPCAGQRLLTDILREKTASQPMNARSAGCVFKNPRVPGVLAAGKLVDEVGLKGLRVGGASVSTKHANFLVCDREGASSSDLAELIRTIRGRVYQERGVLLELEIETWGLADEELRPAM